MKKNNFSPLLAFAAAVLASCFCFCTAPLCAQTQTNAQTHTNGSKVVKYKGYDSPSAVSKHYSREQWGITDIDSTWDSKPGKESQLAKIIKQRGKKVETLFAPIGHCPTGLYKGYPESPMSNWTVDAMFEIVQEKMDFIGLVGENIDFALTNLGGIRSSFPKGEVSAYDVMSIYPFNNKLVVVKLPGTSVRELMENFAKRHRVEAMSHVKITITGNHLDECLINGEPIDTAKVYNVATIDFLLNGGDNVYALKNNIGVYPTGNIVMGSIISHIKSLTKHGLAIEAKKDGRAVVNGEYKK